MLPKSILIVLLAFLLLAGGFTPAQAGSNPVFIQAPPPPPPTPEDQPPWFKNLVQDLANNLSAAGEQIANWIGGAVKELQNSIAQAIGNFLQGLVDQVVQAATQIFQNLVSQTCGALLFLPAGGIAGVWLATRRKHI
jgi:predicted PurR-regulated permease PerM